jgi:hypothetical protein
MNRLMRRIFRPKTEEAGGVWKKLHNKNFHTCNSYILPYIVKAVKLSRMRVRGGEEHVTDFSMKT